MIKAGALTSSMMSKKQRQRVLVQTVSIPMYLRTEIMRNDTEAKRQFNLLAFEMVKGKVDLDPDRLIEIKEQILMERLIVKPYTPEELEQKMEAADVSK